MYKLTQVKSNLSIMPTSAGVYFFKSGEKTLYIGKAKNLRNRIRSYFLQNGLGPKTEKMIAKATELDFLQVDSEFEALLLEAKLINKYKPFYNIASRDDKSPLYVAITREKYPRIRTLRLKDVPISPVKINSLFGPFPTGASVKIILRKIRRIFPFCETRGDKGRPCLHSHIGLCNPCPRELEKTNNKEGLRLYRKNINRIKQVLNGKITYVVKILEKEMTLLSLSQNFETAANIRDQINKLKWLTTPTRNTDEYLSNPNLVEDKGQIAVSALSQLLNIPPPERIEMYDIANLGRDNVTSSMVVALHGIVDSSLYRHFKIKFKDTPNDVASIKETIVRRMRHLEWGVPQLIVVDGGRPQLAAALEALAQNRTPVIALAKRQEEIYTPHSSNSIKLSLDHPGLQLLIRLRNEAHRFSRRLHHNLRSRSLFR